MTPPSHCMVSVPRALAKAEAILAERGRSPAEIPGASEPGMRPAAAATALMDEYRRSGSSDVFESLVQLTSQQLFGRVRSRLRFLGSHLDPSEVLQDAIINIYRYPDRFDASIAGPPAWRFNRPALGLAQRDRSTTSACRWRFP